MKIIYRFERKRHVWDDKDTKIVSLNAEVLNAICVAISFHVFKLLAGLLSCDPGSVSAPVRVGRLSVPLVGSVHTIHMRKECSGSHF